MGSVTTQDHAQIFNPLYFRKTLQYHAVYGGQKMDRANEQLSTLKSMLPQKGMVASTCHLSIQEAEIGVG